MTQVLIRNLSPSSVARLKRRALSRGRSLQAELKILVETAARSDPDRARVVAERMCRRLAGRTHSDSAALLREDRGR
jgi:plasmid stability protein